MYANVNSQNIALFYPESGERTVIKLDLNDIDSAVFLGEVDKLAGFVESASQMTTSHLMTLIRNFTRVLDDTEFINDVQTIDRCLEEDWVTKITHNKCNPERLSWSKITYSRQFKTITRIQGLQIESEAYSLI